MGCGASSDYAASINQQTNGSDPGSTYQVGSVAKLPVNGVGSIDAPVTSGISLAYGSCTIPGYDPARPRRPNQDDFICIEEFQNPSQSLFAVLDGHGTVGHEVARYIKDKLPRNTAKLLNKCTWITEALNDAFVKTNRDLFRSRVDCSISGATSVPSTVFIS
eukprot:SAG31_NODE_76_length_27534_cov_13.661868_16_plen_162_part_00